VRVTGPTGEVRRRAFRLAAGATGRHPNVDALGLEHTTLPRTPPACRCTTAHRPGRRQPRLHRRRRADDRPLLHEAADDGRIAGDNAGRFPDVRMRPRRAPLAVVFSDPQIAIAGASHAELTRAGKAFATGACRSRTRAAAA
jgi:dihydrolipoamide dehydrogenase